jgi:dihydrofolate reductase
LDKTITLIAAMGRNRAIGLDGKMPWHIPAELQHFKAATLGKAIIMGRKTWESIGRPLPGRQNIVVSRNAGITASGAEVVNSLESALQVSGSEENMVIGGGQLYALALPLAQRMVLTLIDLEPEADTWFPEWTPDHWQQQSEQRFPVTEDNAPGYRIVELIRILSAKARF